MNPHPALRDAFAPRPAPLKPPKVVSLLRAEANYLMYAQTKDAGRLIPPDGPNRVKSIVSKHGEKLLRMWRDAGPRERAAAARELDRLAQAERLRAAGMVLPPEGTTTPPGSLEQI